VQQRRKRLGQAGEETVRVRAQERRREGQAEPAEVALQEVARGPAGHLELLRALVRPLARRSGAEQDRFPSGQERHELALAGDVVHSARQRPARHERGGDRAGFPASAA
jgi:hypothetical protein